jgi:Permeases of the major facilitator superfamily
MISLIAPILGTIADYKGYKKKLFNVFSLCGIIMTFGLVFVPENNWIALLLVYIVSHMGFQGSNIFYDGFLVDVTTDERMDDVSSMGYGLGYIGSAFLFVVVMLLQVTDGLGIVPVEYVTKVCFVLTALWWLLFTIPFFKNIHQIHYVEKTGNPILSSLKRMGETVREISKYRHVVLFLFAYFFYIDGVDTIFTMATAVGMDMGIDSNSLILILLLINTIAFPFTIIYGKLAERFGTKPMIIVAIAVYVLICVLALFMQTAVHFLLIGILVGTSQGGIQALSRSYFAKIIPKDKANEFFGFYNIFGKFSAIIGPIIFGFITQVTGSVQFGFASLITLFTVGGIFFFLIGGEK